MRHREEKVTRTHKELYSWHLVNDEACPHLKDYHHFLKGPTPSLAYSCFFSDSTGKQLHHIKRNSTQVALGGMLPAGVAMSPLFN